VAAEGINVKPSTDPSAVPIAVDIGSDGFQYQLTQPAFGPDAGAKTMVDDVDAKRLPVGGAAIGQPGNAAATDTTSAWSLIALLKRLANLQGDVVEAAPATDTASSGLNGRLQRVAQRLTTLFGSLGDTADASVAAGATGSLQAKMRRLSNDIGQMLAACTVTREASGTGDHQTIGATAGLRLMKITAKEDAGTPGLAEFIFRDGTSTAGTAIYFCKLGSSESVRDDFGPDGLPCPNGLFLDRVSGTTDITVFTKVIS
jgi:hypothetical protein